MPESDSALRTADRVGFAASFLCAVHCAVVPLLLALVPALGLRIGGWADIDQAFVVFASLLGLATMSLGYRRHRAFRAWALLLPGLALIWIGSFTSLHDHGWAHALVMTLGGLALAAAHGVNLRLSHRAAP
ncbi:MAG: MerC domain-containing protein [Pseudomonadota bacterium]